MLELLHIENIAIIEAADIEFAPGFNALTGETGAGKSIVIDSLSAVLGQRTSRELIRTGAEKAFVSAAFSGTAPELTEELGIQPEADGTLLLQREIQTDGKNVCRVNGRPVTVGQLRALGARLLNIHGQHDGQQLLDEEQHIVYLDSFGRVESLAITYAEKYKNFTDIRRQIGALQMDEAEKARRVDTLQYQIEELRRAKLTPGEEEELTARRGMLRNAEKFLDAVAGADYALNGDDSGGGALSALRQAQDALSGVRHLDDAFGQLYERLGEAYSEVYDIAATVEDKRGELDVSPGELDRVESRMDLLYRLKKKYGATVEDMLDYQARCEAELAQIEDAGDTLARLEQALSKAEKEARQAAQALSDARKAAADRLADGADTDRTAAAGYGEDTLRRGLCGEAAGQRRHGRGAVPDVRQRGRGAASHPQDRLRRRIGPDHAGYEERAQRAGSRGDDGVRRGGHRRFRPGGPEGGGKNGAYQPQKTGAVRDPSAAAGSYGGHALLRGEGRTGWTDLHRSAAAG